jgi:hypothetical protein
MNHTILAVSICSVCGGLHSIKTPSIHIRYSSYDYPKKKEHYAHTKEIRFFLFLFFSLSVCDQLSNNMKRRRLFLGSFLLFFFSSYLFFHILLFLNRKFLCSAGHNRHSSLTCSLPALLFFT